MLEYHIIMIKYIFNPGHVNYNSQTLKINKYSSFNSNGTFLSCQWCFQFYIGV